MQNGKEQKLVFDILQVGFWALTYTAIVIYSFLYRYEQKVFMPLLAGALNFSWELHALLTSEGFIGHIIWLVLDCFILLYNLYILRSRARRIGYLLCVCLGIALLYGVFSIERFDGMLLSSFIIDAIMAAEYVLICKQISKHGKLKIGILRLLGDLFAWFANLRHSLAVGFLGGGILLLNIFYISCCLEELNQDLKQNSAESGKKRK